MLFSLLVSLLAGVAGASPPPPAPAAPPRPVVLRRPVPAGLVYGPAPGHPLLPHRLSARSFIAVDADSGRILIAYHERQRHPIASLTKVMTALLVIEGGRLDDRARVPKAATLVEPTRDDLVAGRSYRLSTLLYSALLQSANDSAFTLGYEAGGGSLPSFYERMNDAASNLGMADTHYGSPNGLDDRHNWSSARDQAELARYALGDPTFARIVRTHRRLQPWARPIRLKEWINHNRMLVTYPGAYGVKTGFTTLAGACLIEAASRGGHRVIGVLLGSRNVWADMPTLLDAAFRVA